MIETWEILKEKAIAFQDELSYFASTVDEWKEWDSLEEIKKNWQGMMNVAYSGIAIVSYVVNAAVDEFEELNEDDKIKATAKMLDEAIKLPGILEWFDSLIFEFAIRAALDTIKRKFDIVDGFSADTDVYTAMMNDKTGDVLFG